MGPPSMPAMPEDAEADRDDDAVDMAGPELDRSPRRLLARRTALAAGVLGTAGTVVAWSLGGDNSTASDEQTGSNLRSGLEIIPPSQRTQVAPVTGGLLGGGEYDSRRAGHRSPALPGSV